MSPSRFSIPFVGIAVLVGAYGSVRAHEGHAPLPTKGAQVDVAKGTVALSAEARKGLRVQTEKVQLRSLDERLLAYATLVIPWRQHAFATTRIQGRISKLHVKPGQQVNAGETLAEVQSLDLETIQLDLLNAKNAAELSVRTVERLEILGRQRIVPQRNISEARAKHQENLNAIEIARSKLVSLGFSADELESLDRDASVSPALAIQSPIAGVVTHSDLAVGKVVNSNEHLFEIIDPSTMWVRIGVLERDLPRIAAGHEVELSLTAYPGEIFQGTVTIKDRYLDPTTHLGAVWSELENPAGKPPRFLPGMYGQAQVLLRQPQQVCVPAAALIRDGAEHYVLVEESSTARASQYQKRNVVVGLRTAQWVQILSGEVFPGDHVVTSGSHEMATFFVQGVLQLSAEASKNIGLKIAPATTQVIDQIIELDGAVDLPPERKAQVSSQLFGTLTSILIERGQTVRRGQVLAKVASLELQNLQLELLQTQLRIELLEDLLKRLRPLDEQQLLARTQIWEAETQLNESQNRRASLRRKLEQVGLSRSETDALLKDKTLVDHLPLRAPIDGVIVSFDKALGQVIQVDEPLFEIHDLSHVWVQAYVSERDLDKVRLDVGDHHQARIRFVGDSSVVANGVVKRSAQLFGPQNRTLSVWIELQNADALQLQHNMMARISLPVGKSESVLAVPLDAIVREGTRAYVFVQRKDGRMERRVVETGRSDDRNVEIVRGLEPGESVAATGAAGLQTAFASLR